MDPITILNLISKAVTVAMEVYPIAVKTIEDAKPFAIRLYKEFSGKSDITDEELAALEASLDALSAQLQQPLPPE